MGISVCSCTATTVVITVRAITIICGGYDSGKTTRMINVFNNLKMGEADGFACVKVLNAESQTLKYRLRRLTTGQEYDFIVAKNEYQFYFDEFFEFERFVFSTKTLRLAESVMEEAIRNPNIQSLFLDEIGVLELQGQGFSMILRKMLQCDKDLFLCINQKNVDEIQEKFKFSADYHI